MCCRCVIPTGLILWALNGQCLFSTRQITLKFYYKNAEKADRKENQAKYCVALHPCATPSARMLFMSCASRRPRILSRIKSKVQLHPGLCSFLKVYFTVIIFAPCEMIILEPFPTATEPPCARTTLSGPTKN